MEEEREKELEELYESTLISQMEKANVGDNMEVDTAGRQTMETLKAGERIIEAIDIGDEEKLGWEAYESVSDILITLFAPCLTMANSHRQKGVDYLHSLHKEIQFY